MRVLNVSQMKSDEDLLLILPEGAVLHIEVVDHDDPQYRGIRVRGYRWKADYEADERVRLNGQGLCLYHFNDKIEFAKGSDLGEAA